MRNRCRIARRFAATSVVVLAPLLGCAVSGGDGNTLTSRDDGGLGDASFDGASSADGAGDAKDASLDKHPDVLAEAADGAPEAASGGDAEDDAADDADGTSSADGAED